MSLIETPRMILRQWRDEDLEPFAKINADPRVMTYFPKALNKRESDGFAQAIRSEIQVLGYGLFAVAIKETDQFAGFVGLHVPTYPLPFSPCVEIGWRLASDYWNRGLATEAARACVGAGFESFGLKEIVSFTAVQNLASRRVMEKIGMSLDCEFEHPKLTPGDPLCRHVLYRVSHQLA